MDNPQKTHSISDQFYDQVSSTATDTVFEVVRTPDGFNVTTNVADARWSSLLHAQGVRKVFTHRVRIDERNNTFSITDDSYDLEWRNGVAHLSATAKRQLGTVHRYSSRTTFDLTASTDQPRSVDKVVDYQFNTSHGRRLITDAANDLGLAQQRNPYTRIGLIVAFIATAGAGAAIVAVLVQ